MLFRSDDAVADLAEVRDFLGAIQVPEGDAGTVLMQRDSVAALDHLTRLVGDIEHLRPVLAGEAALRPRVTQTTAEARDALLAALAYRRVKTVVAVGEDVDIFSPQSLQWALATRVQWSRDTIVVDGMSGSALDPSLDPPGPTTSKVGIDASRRSPGTQVSTVPQAAIDRAAEFLAGAAGKAWPRS